MFGVPDYDARTVALPVNEIGQQPFDDDTANYIQPLIGEPDGLDARNLDDGTALLLLRRGDLHIDDDVRSQAHAERTVMIFNAVSERNGDFYTVKIFESCEAAKPFSAACYLLRCLKRSD